jgi:hypothetical protein
VFPIFIISVPGKPKMSEDVMAHNIRIPEQMTTILFIRTGKARLAGADERSVCRRQRRCGISAFLGIRPTGNDGGHFGEGGIVLENRKAGKWRARATREALARLR